MKGILEQNVLDEMFQVIDNQLEKRHWGIRAHGTSPGNKPRYYIIDYRGFGLVTGLARYYFFREEKTEGTKLFYRGQKQDWELRPSLYRNCKTKEDIERANAWRKLALDSIEDSFDYDGLPADREALAQHYGLRTQFIDVVDHIQTALWFAYDETESDKNRARQDESVGYIEVVAVPSDAEIIDLRRKPSEWLRPHIQQGFCVRFPKPDADLGRISKYLVMIFIVSRQNLRLWSNYDAIPHDYFYPNGELDQGAVYWEKARSKLLKVGLID